MNDALVKALGSRIPLKKVAIHKSTALEPQLPFAQLEGKFTGKIYEHKLIHARLKQTFFHLQPTIVRQILTISK